MRNLKRALSLAVASVMLLGMMVVGTGAASYTDVTSKNNQEAIEILKTVGVMTGDEKGNFNPDKKVTRNEMAVVMANLLNLKTGGTTPFTDVPAWAAPVAACYNNNIIAGISKTTYGGDLSVTAAQASLMLMKALGYFSYQGEFGDDWQLASIKQANKIDLFDGINANATTALTRNDVAQLTLNALESTMVVVEQQGGMTVDGNGMTVVVNPTYKYDDIVNKSGRDYAGKPVITTMELTEKLYGNDLKKNGNNTDDFGRPATQWTYGTSTITTAKAADLTYTKAVKGKAIYEDLGKVSGITIDNGTAGNVSVDGKDDTLVNNGMTGLAIVSGNAVEIGGKGTLTEVYFDKDTKEATIVLINSYLAQANDDYDADDKELDITVHSGITMASGATTLDGEDFAISGYEKDDYFLVTAKNNGSDYTIKSIAPVTVVKDVKVGAYKASDYVTAGGTKYEYNTVAKTASSGALGQNAYMAGTYTLQDTTYDLFLDASGYVIGVDTHSSDVNLGDYVFVKEAAQSGFQFVAKALFMDGTTKNIVVTKTAKTGGAMAEIPTGTKVEDGTALAADGGLSKNRFYTFTANKDGEYQLTDLADTTRQAKVTGAIVNGPATPVTGGKPANSNTVFVAKENVYTGVKNAPDVASSAVYTLLDKDGKYMLAAYTATKGTTSSSASEYVYITSGTPGSAKDEDDNTYYLYDAVINGKKVSGGLKASGKTASAAGLYEITGYTDGYADLSAVIAADVTNELTYLAGAKALEAKDDVLTVTKSDDTEGNFVLADNVVIYSIDGTDSYAAKTITQANINNLSGTFTVYLVQASSSNENITIAYLVKTA